MKAQVQAQIKDAMRAKDKVALQTLRSLLSAFQYEEMQKQQEELNEQQSLAIVRSEIKKRKESLEFAEKAQREEEQKTLLEELRILESFLPAQLSEEALQEILVKLKTEKSDSNMGAAMKFLQEQYAGCYDGKTASKLAKEIFS